MYTAYMAQELTSSMAREEELHELEQTNDPVV
jgi:hypothetical protein